MSKLTDDIILKAGYTEYEPSIIDGHRVTKCFQKWFKDDFGKRYAICVKKWDWSDSHIDIGIKYEFETQMTINEKPINITLFSGWDIEEAEYHMERLWLQNKCDYYERWVES